MIKFDELPNWIAGLEPEDLNFIKKFVISSGSIKDLAALYEVTYPTLRTRLDKLIDKVKMYDSEITDPYIEKIKLLALDGRMDLETAKILISEYKQRRK